MLFRTQSAVYVNWGRRAWKKKIKMANDYNFGGEDTTFKWNGIDNFNVVSVGWLSAAALLSTLVSMEKLNERNETKKKMRN